MSSIPDLIRKKRDGERLSDEEIKTFLHAVTSRNIQDSQTGRTTGRTTPTHHIQTLLWSIHCRSSLSGAMLMAIWQKGMVDSEIETLTKEMILTGEVLSWPREWAGHVVDKHSTGGVGDKVSLVLAPALAACGCKVQTNTHTSDHHFTSV